GCRGEWPDAWHGHQAPCGIAARSDGLDLAVHRCDALFELHHLAVDLCKDTTHRRGEFVALICQHARHLTLELARALMDRNAVLQAEGPHLADKSRSMGDHPISHAVKCLQVDLLRGPDLDEAHRRPRHCFRDGLRVDDVVLVRLHEWLHELRWYDSNCMPHRLKLAR